MAAKGVDAHERLGKGLGVGVQVGEQGEQIHGRLRSAECGRGGEVSSLGQG
jgi:hypothetical protein